MGLSYEKRLKLFLNIALSIIILSWLLYQLDYNNYSMRREVTSERQINDLFFSSNLLHWSHMPLTYKIIDRGNCGHLQVSKMLEAFDIIQNNSNYIRFVPSNSLQADIVVQCIDVDEIRNSYFQEIDRLKREKLNCIEKSYPYKKESLSTYTEGVLDISEHLFVNASQMYLKPQTVWTICYINLSDISNENIANYGVEDWRDISNSVLGDARPISQGLIIRNGTINLYKPENGWAVCTDFPAKEIHELLHLFGFDHIEEPYWDPYYGYVDLVPVSDIMFPYMNCNLQKKIQEKYLYCLDYIYSNGKVGFCNPDLSFISTQSKCADGLYPVEGTGYCCPEPNMTIEEGYCV